MLTYRILHELRSVLSLNYVKQFVRKNQSLTILDKNVDTSQNNDLASILPTKEDLSFVTPYFPKSYNVAAYVNSSDSLKKLVQLNVDLSKIEKKTHIMVKLLKLDFEKDIQKHLLFLKDFVELENLGKYITKNPEILCEPLDDLQVRINYLQSKSFTMSDIKSIISRNAFWLMFSTMRIDRKLGFFQKQFHLHGKEVRSLALASPKLITYSLEHVKTNTFIIKEEMGFTDMETKELILKRPKLWIMSMHSLRNRFNYIHNVMKIPHHMILKFPNILESRNFRIKQRHEFLEKLGRAQYDPKKENYVPVTALVEGADIDFCKTYAKCNIDDFNMFLKTM